MGHGSSARKLTNKIKSRLADGSAEEDKQWMKQSLEMLKGKIDLLRGLNNQIIELIGSLDGEDVGVHIEKEIEDSDHIREEVNEIVWRLEEILSSSSIPQPKPRNVPTQRESPTSGSSQQYLVKVKLPKLEVKKFSGRLQDWQEFWDFFQSLIDGNESLSAVDNLLEELAAQTSMIDNSRFHSDRSELCGCSTSLKERIWKEDSYSKSPYK